MLWHHRGPMFPRGMMKLVRLDIFPPWRMGTSACDHPSKSIKNQLQNDIQDSIPKFNTLWPENQTQDTSKTLPRRPHDAPRRPKTLQDLPKTAPRRLQDDPKTPPRRFKIVSRRPQDGSKPPKTPQNASKTPQDAPRRLQDASRL